ncbi:TPA: UxaA family hydrolase [Burkholderia cenocepacia]|nr:MULTISPECIES: UxaA family hydrolase [Burkholderia]MBJ9922831.1 UxaA family hydrolase [Burkholderia cenocepacia]UJH78831.1 UxaA family hydrolase [Burkholderia cenocepacia]VWB22599.1 Altronate dehydratase [Burkholderia latens]
MNASVLPSTFNGYVREDGRVGTRNYIGVLVVGNCAATAARQVAAWFTPKRLAAYPNVDGVVPFVHELGCGMEKSGEPMDLLRRTLGGSIRNPNLAGAVVMALGCERNNIYGFLEQEGLEPGPMLKTMVLQEVGGTRAAIDGGIAAVEDMLIAANRFVRTRASVEHLVVGLLAQPDLDACNVHAALGHAVDRLVAEGGTAIVTDTARNAPRLAARSGSGDVRNALEQRIDWWTRYTANRDTPIPDIEPVREAPSSLPHSGSTPLQAVFSYGQPVATKGLVLMDCPGHEAAASSGLVASGATMIGIASRGVSIFGATGAPTLKLAVSAAQFARYSDDLDIDGSVVDAGSVSIEALGDAIFNRWLACASGDATRSEELGIGECEFVPWSIGVLA